MYPLTGKCERHAALLGLCLAAACGSPATESSAPVAAIEIAPAAVTLAPGVAQALTASVTDASGGKVAAGQLHWSAQDPRIATVSPQGVVTAVAPGRTQIAASRRGVSGLAVVTVTALPAAVVRVSPTSTTVQVGASATLTAQVFDAGGRPLSMGTSWNSDRPGVAQVDANGRVTGVATGTALITASAGSLYGTAVVSVQPVPVASVSVSPSTASVKEGRQIQLTATARDAAGNVLSGRQVVWSSSNPKVAVALQNGVVATLSDGTATITATVDGQSGSATITVY